MRSASLATYLSLGLVAGLASTTGANILARLNIAGEQWSEAWADYLHNDLSIGTIILVTPFFGNALICAYATRYARFRSTTTVFVVATIVLVYFYFQDHLAAQEAMQEGHWTAAALSVGLLPFFAGGLVFMMTLPAVLLAAKFDPACPDRSWP